MMEETGRGRRSGDERRDELLGCTKVVGEGGVKYLR